MSAKVLTLATEPNVVVAWEAYQSLLHDLQRDPLLQSDPDYTDRLTAAERHWHDLFLKWSNAPTNMKAIQRQ
jgi:hypothetical protein